MKLTVQWEKGGESEHELADDYVFGCPDLRNAGAKIELKDGGVLVIAAGAALAIMTEPPEPEIQPGQIDENDENAVAFAEFLRRWNEGHHGSDARPKSVVQDDLGLRAELIKLRSQLHQMRVSRDAFRAQLLEARVALNKAHAATTEYLLS